MRLLTLLLAACVALASSNAPGAGPGAEDARFAEFTDRTLALFWRLNPEHAFAEGYYKHADQLAIPDAAARAEEL